MPMTAEQRIAARGCRWARGNTCSSAAAPAPARRRRHAGCSPRERWRTGGRAVDRPEGRPRRRAAAATDRGGRRPAVRAVRSTRPEHRSLAAAVGSAGRCRGASGRADQEVRALLRRRVAPAPQPDRRGAPRRGPLAPELPVARRRRRAQTGTRRSAISPSGSRRAPARSNDASRSTPTGSARATASRTSPVGWSPRAGDGRRLARVLTPRLRPKATPSPSTRRSDQGGSRPDVAHLRRRHARRSRRDHRARARRPARRGRRGPGPVDADARRVRRRDPHGRGPRRRDPAARTHATTDR